MLTKTRPCQSKNPAQCRHHGQPLTKLETALTKCKTSEEYIHIRDLIQETKIKTYLQTLPQKPLTTGFDETKLTVETDSTKTDRNNGDWTQYWVNNETGKPIGFIKVHIYKNEQQETQKVVVCDIEINPEFKGKNAALSVLRKIKQTLNVPYLQTGDTFSEKGHEMYKRLRGHELATGETILKLDEWTAKKEPDIIGHNSYSFVKNWDEKIPKYPI